MAACGESLQGHRYGGKIGEVYNVEGHNERPNIFIVKTIIEQLHDRLKDDGISEELIKQVEDCFGHDCRYGIDPTKIKNDLGWYQETPFEKGIVLTIDWYLRYEDWMNNVPPVIIISTTRICIRLKRIYKNLFDHENICN